jgi:uncharacterized membrane protein
LIAEMKWNAKYIAQAGIIASLYAALVVLGTFTPVGFLMFGPVQVRISEALSILPYFTPAAIPGLFIGCVTSNMAGVAFAPGLAVLGWWDVLFGSLASLAAALFSRALRKHRWLVPLPPVIFNAIVLGLEFTLSTHTPFWLNALTVGAGQAVACYFLGMPLLFALEKKKGLFT